MFRYISKQNLIHINLSFLAKYCNNNDIFNSAHGDIEHFKRSLIFHVNENRRVSFLLHSNN